MSNLKRIALLSMLALLLLPAAGAGTSAPARGGLVEVVVTLDAPPVARGGHVRTLAAVQGSVESELAATVPQAEIQHRYSYVLDGLAVKVPSSDLDRVQDMPGVTGVYPSVTYRSLRSSTPGFIGAPAVWGPTLKTAGQGVKIGIIDDGVNQTHPYFNPKGYKMPRGFPKGQKRFTTRKVIVARAFAPRSPKWKFAGRPFDPLNSEHATHVAGIAAGNYRTKAARTRVSGVAPRAYIGNYKVLSVPDDGFGLNGNSPEIVAGIEAAVRDGMDVINLSLGEAEIDPSRDIVARALDGAAAAGVVSVVAAGNDYEELGAGSVSSPGSSARAITAAAESESGPFIASFSSGGPTPISLRMKPDVTAPGVDVLSSVPRREGLWASFSGTSMADAARVRRRGSAAPAASRLDGRPDQVRARADREAGAGRGRRRGRDDTGRRRHDRPGARGQSTPLRVADGPFVRFRRSGRLGRAPGCADRRGRWSRAVGRERHFAAGRQRRVRQRAADDERPRPARRHRDRFAGRPAGDAHRLRRAQPGLDHEAHPVLVPRCRAGTPDRAGDAAHANGHVSRRHSREAFPRRLVPVPGGRAPARGRALIAWARNRSSTSP